MNSVWSDKWLEWKNAKKKNTKIQKCNANTNALFRSWKTTEKYHINFSSTNLIIAKQSFTATTAFYFFYKKKSWVMDFTQNNYFWHPLFIWKELRRHQPMPCSFRVQLRHWVWWKKGFEYGLRSQGQETFFYQTQCQSGTPKEQCISGCLLNKSCLYWRVVH